MVSTKLLLIKLTNLIHQGSRIDTDISAATFKKMIIIQSILPTKDYDINLTFPYNDSAERISKATNGLTIMNQPFFKFCNEEKEELRSIKIADVITMENRKTYFLFFKDQLLKL